MQFRRRFPWSGPGFNYKSLFWLAFEQMERPEWAGQEVQKYHYRGWTGGCWKELLASGFRLSAFCHTRMFVIPTSARSAGEESAVSAVPVFAQLLTYLHQPVRMLPAAAQRDQGAADFDLRDLVVRTRHYRGRFALG